MPVKAPSPERESREEVILRCLALGMSVRESCERAAADYGLVRAQLSRGRRVPRPGRPPTRDRRLYFAVLEAQGRFREEAYTSLIVAAKAGNAGAAQALMERAERLSLEREAEEVPDDPLEAARYRLRDLRVRIRESSGIAYTQMLREESALQTRIEALLLAGSQQRDPRSMPPEEWRAVLEGDATSAPDCDLEVYVAEWLRRTGARIVHDRQQHDRQPSTG
jgi:hypothetical protein